MERNLYDPLPIDGPLENPTLAKAERGSMTLAEANRDRIEFALREIARQKREDRSRDPFGGALDDEGGELSKHRHILQEKMRVRLVDEPHRVGRISIINRAGKAIVKFDGQEHETICSPDEIEPVSWNEHRSAASSKAGSFGEGLVRAIEQGTISASDRAALESEVNETPKAGGRHSYAVLKNLVVKYADGGDVLAKRARPGLRVGLKVRDAHSGKVGTIAAIEGHMVKVRFDDGSGESFSAMGATMETLIPVEAA